MSIIPASSTNRCYTFKTNKDEEEVSITANPAHSEKTEIYSPALHIVPLFRLQNDLPVDFWENCSSIKLLGFSTETILDIDYLAGLLIRKIRVTVDNHTILPHSILMLNKKLLELKAENIKIHPDCVIPLPNLEEGLDVWLYQKAIESIQETLAFLQNSRKEPLL